MRRYWINDSSIKGDSVKIDGDIFHHIFDVCRQEQGSRFEVLTEKSEAFLVEVTELGKKSAQAKVMGRRQIPPLKRPHIVLAMSVPRFPVFESVLEKAVEMGVHTVVPFFSDFSFVRSASSWPSQKLSRWEKIIVSATQQSGRGELMKLTEPQHFRDLKQFFNPNSNRKGLFAYEGSSATPIKQYIAAQKFQDLQEMWIFVGSEGGFSQAEVQMFEQCGLAPVTLGEQVLRVETACITLVSILKYELGIMG